MFNRLQHYLYLVLVLYLLGCLVHDICVYHIILAENTARLKIEDQKREILSHRLGNLIQLIEKEHIDNKSKESLATLNNKLN